MFNKLRMYIQYTYLRFRLIDSGKAIMTMSQCKYRQLITFQLSINFKLHFSPVKLNLMSRLTIPSNINLFRPCRFCIYKVTDKQYSLQNNQHRLVFHAYRSSSFVAYAYSDFVSTYSSKQPSRILFISFDNTLFFPVLFL